MSINQKDSYGEPSIADGLVKLRDAASTGDLEAFEDVFTGLIARDNSPWSRFFTLAELKLAQCKNYDGIIRVADQILNDPKSSASDKKWAQGKRDAAVEGKAKNGCATNIS